MKFRPLIIAIFGVTLLAGLTACTPDPGWPPPREVAVAYSASSDPQFCNVNITLTNFAPNQTVSVSLAHTSAIGQNPAQSGWVWNLTTDGTGSASYTPFTYYNGASEAAQLKATADGVSSGFALVAC